MFFLNIDIQIYGRFHKFDEQDDTEQCYERTRGGSRLVGMGVSVSRSHMSLYLRTGEGDRRATRVVLLI